MSDVTFTDTITVQVIDSAIDESNFLFAQASFEVTAPLSAWLDHTDTGFHYTDTDLDDPLFYLPGPHRHLQTPQQYLVRGTLETLAETGWEAFCVLLDAGVDHLLARSALPSNFMISRVVEATGLTLSRFVERHRHYSPGNEVTVIAAGYAAHLAETAPNFLFHNH